MISRDAIAPCVKRTFGISPVLTVENGGRTRPFSKVCWKAANSVPLIPADVLIVLMVSSTGKVFETKRSSVVSTKPARMTDSRRLYYNNRVSVVQRRYRWDTYVTKLVVRLSSYCGNWSGKRWRIMRKDHTVIVTLMLLTSWILRALMMSPTDILAALGAGAALTKARERSQRSPTYRALDIIVNNLSSWEKVWTEMW